MRSLRRLFGGSETRTPFRDPAPTRWAYRYQRLMLTPAFRATLRIGAPAALLLFIIGYWSAQPENRAALATQISDLKTSFQHRPEFMVTGLDVTGAKPSIERAITALVTEDFPVSSWEMDLPGLRENVVDLAAVDDAVVRIRTGGVLEIAVSERAPVAVWRHIDGLRLIDVEGNLISMIPSRADRADLPLIAGDGAMGVIDEAMELFAIAEPVSDRVRGLVRMGERRWDLVLDRGQRILLPEEGAVDALNRVIALHLAQDMLTRDITRIDMRNAQRPTVQLGSLAIRSIEPVVPFRAGEAVE